MAQYYAVIPNSISAKCVFECINHAVVAGMDGLIVEANGNERMSDFFSVDRDIVYKACTDQNEIFQKIESGSLVGSLVLQTPNWRISVYRNLSKTEADDCSIPNFTSYTVGVTLIGYQAVNDHQEILKDYERWLDPLEPPSAGNRSAGVYGKTKDVILHYRLPSQSIVRLLKKVSIMANGPLAETYGHIQERSEMRRFEIDLDRYGFRGLYSVWPDWPVANVSNYKPSDYERFCSAVDEAPKGVFVSVGRKYLAYRAQDGRTTRTLCGNCFQIYRTKTRRSVSVGFEQYSDEDIPVRRFSGQTRANLRALNISI